MPDQFEVRTDDVITSDSDPNTPATAKELHDWPGDLGVEARDEQVTIAIMDSGIHQDAVDNHPWFEHAEVAERYDATGSGTGGDTVGHGTGCASIYGTAAASVLAAATEHDVPVQFYDVRIFGGEGRTDFTTIADAYRWMIDHADDIDIANLSWGARQDVSAIDSLHEKLVAEGVHDIVAAGNTGGEGGSPATAGKSFSAGAVNAAGDPTRFTSRDPNQTNPDVAALGKDCKLARAPGTSMGRPINENFVSASGTSFAAPYTGAAYTLAYYMTPKSWDRPFERYAPDIPGTKADGEGLLKLAPAFDGEAPEAPNPRADGTVWSFLGNDTLYLGEDWLPSGDVVVEKTGEEKDHVDLRIRSGGGD